MMGYSYSFGRAQNLTCFHASFFPFCPLCQPPLFLPFLSIFLPFSPPSKSALFCRAKRTAHSLERGSFRMDISTEFGKEIPSRNLREKRSGINWCYSYSIRWNSQRTDKTPSPITVTVLNFRGVNLFAISVTELGLSWINLVTISLPMVVQSWTLLWHRKMTHKKNLKQSFLQKQITNRTHNSLRKSAFPEDLEGHKILSKLWRMIRQNLFSQNFRVRGYDSDSVRAPLCCKNLCRASDSCMSGRGARGSRPKNLSPEGLWSKCLSRGTLWGSWTKLASRASQQHPEPENQDSQHKPTQPMGVFPWMIQIPETQTFLHGHPLRMSSGSEKHRADVSFHKVGSR